MREFNAFEKEVLSKMVPLQKDGKLCRYNLLIGIIDDIEIEKNGSIDIQIVSNTINKNEIRKMLVQLSFLFMYLESNYYLLDFKRDICNKTEINDPILNKKYILKTDKSYPNEYFIYRDTCFYELLLSETIVDIVNNNFKSVEQRRFEKQYCISKIALITAIIIGVASIIFNICALHKDTIINPTQIEEIRQEIKSVKTRIESAVPIISDDTLNVNIVDKDLKIKH